jgi:predicted MFS family arabinose efflux permease
MCIKRIFLTTLLDVTEFILTIAAFTTFNLSPDRKKKLETVAAVVTVGGGVIASAVNYLALLHARPESGRRLCHSVLIHVGMSVLADSLCYRGLNDII